MPVTPIRLGFGPRLPPTRRRLGLGHALILGIILWSASLPAQIWTGAASTTWSDAANWSGGVPGNTATATFNSNTANDPNLTAVATTGKLLFNSGADAETFTGSTLTLNGVSSLGIDNQSGVTQTFNNTLSVAAAQTWNAGSGALSFGAVSLGGNLTLTGSDTFTFAGATTLTANRTLTNNATGSVTFSGGLTGANRTLTVAGTGDTNVTGAITIGSGALIKTGTGTLTMSGANTYTGANTIGTSGGTSGGTLRLGAANILANNTTTVYAGTLDLNGYNDTIGALTLGGGATGTTAAVTTGAGTLTLGGNVTYSATNNANGATISGNLALGGANRTFTIGNSTNAADDVTVDAVISGGNAVIKSGTGTLVLSGANTYTGTTTVSGGVLNIRHAGALGTTAAGTTVGSGFALQLQGNIAVGAESLSLTGTGVSTTGALRNISGDNSWAGLVTLAGNTQITADAGSLDLSGGVTGANRTLTVTGAGDLTIGGLSLGTGGLIKTGTGTLTLDSSNSGTGATTIGAAGGASAGTLRLGAANGLASGAVTLYAGTLDLNGYSDTIGALTLGGGATGTSAAVTTGAGTLTLGGNLTYSATNNPNAATISGRLDLGGANRTFNIGDSTNAADDVTIDAVISGSAGFNKATSTGTLVLTGANTYTGLTQVTAGALNIRHSQALGSTAAGTTVTSGDQLQLQGGIAVGAEALSLAGTGLSTTGALRNISGDNSWAGLVTLTAASRVQTDAGSLAFTGGVTAANFALTVAGAGDTSISGPINLGTAALNKLDAATLTLAGTNSGTGATTVGTAGGTTGGTLRLGAANGLASGAVTVYAGTLDLNGYNDTIGALNLGGGTSGTTAAVTTGAGTITLGGNVTYTATNNPNAATISGLLDLGGANRTFTINDTTAGAPDTTVSAAISGSAGLIKQGAGTLVLSGANTYTGTTSVSAGVLNIQHGSALGSTAAGTVVTTGDQLQVQGGIAVGAEALSLAGTGIGSTGALRNVSGDNSWAGLVTLTAATQINSDAGTLSLTGGVTGANRALTLAGTGNFAVTSITTGTGSLTKEGSGTAALSGTSTYTGATAIDAGTLRLDTSETLSNSTAVTVAAGATFDVNDQTETVATIAGAGTIDLGAGSLATAGTGSTTFSGAMTGTGGFTKGGTGTLTLSGDSTYTGATAVSAGILRIGAAEALANSTAVTVAAGATFDVNDQTETVGTVAGAGTIDLGAGSLITAGNGSTTFSGAIIGAGGSLTKQGTGTLTLSGVSSYTGATAVQGGTLQLGASNLLANTTAVTVAAGATFDVNDFTETVATIAGAGTVDLGLGTLITAGNGNTTFSGLLAGTGTFTKQGTGILTLDNDFSFNGTFNLAGGTLRLSDMALTLGTLNITGNSIIDFAGVSSLDVTNFTISAGVTLTIQNWADLSDYFFAQNWTGATFEVRGATPMNQVTFNGFAANDTKWQAYDSQITPVPEPSTYGALLLAALAGLGLWRRSVRRAAR